MYLHTGFLPTTTAQEYNNRFFKVEMRSTALGGIYNENIIFTGSFYVHAQCASSTGLGCPAIKIYGSKFQVNEEIQMEIINAEPDKPYVVWWEGKSLPQQLLWNGSFSIGELSDPPNVGEIYNIRISRVDQGSFCMKKAQALGTVSGLDCVFRVPSSGSITIQADPVLDGDDNPLISNITGVPTNPPAITTATPLPSVPPPCSKYVKVDDNGNIVRPYNDVTDLVVTGAYPPEWKYTCLEVDTAVGPIETSAVGIIKRLFGIILGLSGGIAVILIITSGYTIMTSQGNAEKLQKAREILTSTIVGLLFMIFSLVILNTIGVDILAIPGLTK